MTEKYRKSRLEVGEPALRRLLYGNRIYDV